MAENSVGKSISVSSSVLQDLSKLVWGPNLKDEVFQRWAQGFEFSEDEATALLQFEGGPCAVIAPVQAFLLKHALFKHEDDWRNVREDVSYTFLIRAMSDILQNCKKEQFFIASTKDRDDRSRSDHQSESTSSQDFKDNIPTTEEGYFRCTLKIRKFTTVEEVESFLQRRKEKLKQPFAVLSFLYSVLLTKGIEHVKNEMEDPNEPLIDGTYGHGSQSLINLMLTGRAVSNVWDNDKDVSGLKLQGISSQSEIGFLTLLEHLRYCEVGWFLKCPEYPVWVIGSETHLTIMFSKERSLVSPETPESAARRVFKQFDPEGNNFIQTVFLEDVLKALDLFSDAEYVEAMKQKLDPDGYGIILLNSFMDEFFPIEKSSPSAKSFTVYHYNGLKRSCTNGKVQFQEGKAFLLDDDLKCSIDATPIITCLQTKWPGIEVQWTSGISPSII